MKLSPIALAVIAGVLSPQSFAQVDENNTKAIEIITISAPKRVDNQTALAQGNLIKPDVADWLATVPGANINKNGPITGIAQYRGMYGDRVAKSISGHHIVSAGPNAMDAPLTYVNPMMVESVSVYRGIAPVSAGMDTIGGAIEVNLKRAQPGANLSVNGDLASSYNSINDGRTLAGALDVSAQSVAVLGYFSDQQGNDYQDANGNTITSTQYSKQQLGIDSRYQDDTLSLGLTWHKSLTENAGTPALPMDINDIDSQRVNTDGQWQAQHWLLQWQLGYQDASHTMDNFSQRLNMMPAMHRFNTAKAKTLDYALRMRNDSWLLALEGFDASHDSTITNPSQPMFKVANFNQVQDARHSALLQWSSNLSGQSHTVGLRVKHNSSDAGDVASSMAMMSEPVKALQNEFNGQEKHVSDVTADLVLNSQIDLNQQFEFSYAVAIKQRAPSYQERYLWLPMQSTGGLADGKTYVGNINLNPETAYQIDLGLSFEQRSFKISPHIFAQRINDYIQGTPSNDMRVKMVSAMMGNEQPLQFSNIDATIYGADINWQVDLSEQLRLTGIASYVRGKRQDTKDDLYRQAPLNTRVNLFYHQENWQTKLSLHAYAKQSHVARLNNEKSSAGYTLIDWQADYFVSQGLMLKLGVDNLLDKQYSSHLSGVNRANGSDIAVNQAIPGMGRNVYLALDYQF